MTLSIQKIGAALGIKNASKAKAATKTIAAIAKPSAKAAEQTGAEAMANQGRAMVNFTKPSAEELSKKNPKSLKACSGWGDGGDW